jgi:hypothetical protein
VTGLGPAAAASTRRAFAVEKQIQVGLLSTGSAQRRDDHCHGRAADRELEADPECVTRANGEIDRPTKPAT